MWPPDSPALCGRSLDSVGHRWRTVFARSLNGLALDRDSAIALLRSNDPELFRALIAVAHEVRCERKGRVVTYSPKVFLPITNLCLDRCGYCTFRADPNDPHAWTMLPEEVRALCRQGSKLGCTEALLCLGDKPERAFKAYRSTLAVLGANSTIDYVARCSAIALEEDLLPHTNAGLLNREDMLELRATNPSLGLMLENVSPRLRERGEAHAQAPDKDPMKRLAVIRQAGELRIPFTTGILLGIGETASEVVDSLLAIREMHEEFAHIQEIIIQNFRAKPTTRMALAPEPSIIDTAKTVAVARLLAPTMNIQAPPNLNPFDHRLLLHAGLNDWGGISPLTPDFVNPEAPWPHVAALEQLCRDEGFTLLPRLPVYPEYASRSEFIDERLKPKIELLSQRLAKEKGVLRC
ncbi:MAG: 7,8-didemethyl-8-hydroxy-5-deazariboflavin synthase CofG [Candidatus Binatia bacterium]|nr:7,8-didemethyl-8-hydroxy-5-deazariboflavin synthase CofG [Candidatus Binatia bacterium]